MCVTLLASALVASAWKVFISAVLVTIRLEAVHSGNEGS
jgi:hypothetical protein